MSRIPPTPAEIMDRELDGLARLVSNLLVNNKNFESQESGKEAHYFREHPRTHQFVSGPLKEMAEHILGKIEEAKELSRAMAAEPEVEGLSRSYSGQIEEFSINIDQKENGKWKVSMAIGGAFHNGDDFSGDFESESDALQAVQHYQKTGNIPAGMIPDEEYQDAQHPHP